MRVVIAPEPPTRRRLQPAERGRLIEQAATQLFAARGYAATSVEDIVSAAGVTKPMLYRHFESKRELCIRLLQRYRDELVDAPLAELAAAGSAGDSGESRDRRLGRMIEAWLAWVAAHPDAARLLFTPIRGDRQVEEVQLELFKRQRDTQSALLLEFAPGLSASLAEPLGEITRAGFAAVAVWLLDHPDHPREAAREALLTMARGIIAAVNAQEAPASRG